MLSANGQSYVPGRPNLCVDPTNPSPDELLRYEGPGITIQYPCNWQEIDPTQLGETADPSLLVAFSAPLDSESDIFAENLAITSEKTSALSTQIGADGSINTPLKDIVDYQVNTEFPSNVPDFQFNESTPLTLSGGTHPALAVTFHSNQEGVGPIKTMAVFVKDGDEVFAISYNAQPDQFDKYLPVAVGMIDSLEFFNLDTYMDYDGIPGLGSSSQNPPDRIITPDCGVVTDGTPCYE